jgi:hypothetical protein
MSRFLYILFYVYVAFYSPSKLVIRMYFGMAQTQRSVSWQMLIIEMAKGGLKLEMSISVAT